MATKRRRNPPVKQPRRKPKTLWHRLLGKWLELLLTRVDITVYTEPQVMSDPPKVDILLLRRNSSAWTPAQLRLLPDGVRDTLAAHILIEFKFTESLNRARFQQALGYDYFYRQAQKVAEAEIQTFIFSAKTPPPTFLQEYGYSVTEYAGVYRSANPMLQPVLLLLLNELRPELHNAFVQCFASRGHVRRGAFQRLEAMDWQEVDEAFWDFFVGLQSHLVEESEDITMKKREALTPETILETGKQLRKSLLAVLTPEERLAGLAPAERLAGLAPAELRRLLEENVEARHEAIALASPAERLLGLTTEEMIALMGQIERYLRQQQQDAENANTEIEAKATDDFVSSHAQN